MTGQWINWVVKWGGLPLSIPAVLPAVGLFVLDSACLPSRKPPESNLLDSFCQLCVYDVWTCIMIVFSLAS